MLILSQQKQQAQSGGRNNGFALPTVLVMSLILLIIGVSTLQVNSAVNRSLVDQDWNLMAKTATESGVAFANACVNQSTIPTTPLTPNMTCTGSTVTASTNLDSDTSSIAAPSPWRSTYNINTPVTGSDGLKRSLVTGKVEVLSPGGVVVKSYTTSQPVLLVPPPPPPPYLPPHPACTNVKPLGAGYHVKAGQFLCLNNSHVNGAIDIDGGGGMSLLNSFIGGSLDASGGPTSITICSSHINGAIDVQGATGLVVIGDDQYSCPGNTIGGAAIISGNQAGMSLFGNSVTGPGAMPPLATNPITNNLGGAAPEAIPKVGANTFDSNITCSGNLPSLTNDGQANNVVSPGTRAGQCTGSF